MKSPLSPKIRAERAAAAMWENDEASKWFGMRLDEIDEGYAVLSLTVGTQHCNGHGTCHGGVSFALADSAFAFACNSRNQLAVGQHTSMNYVAPAKAGDILTATAHEASQSGRSGVYDVRVTNQDGTLIALFRGLSRSLNGHHFEEE